MFSTLKPGASFALGSAWENTGTAQLKQTIKARKRMRMLTSLIGSEPLILGRSNWTGKKKKGERSPRFDFAGQLGRLESIGKHGTFCTVFLRAFLLCKSRLTDCPAYNSRFKLFLSESALMSDNNG